MSDSNCIEPESLKVDVSVRTVEVCVRSVSAGSVMRHA